MKKLILSVLAIAMLQVAKAQESVNGSFNTIRISGSAEVHVKQSAQSSVTINGSDNVGGISISNNRLSISRVYSQPIYVTMPTLESLEISGNGEVVIDTAFTINNLEIEVSGNCKANLNLQGGVVTLKTSGNFNGTLKGSADAFNASVSGRANVYADKFVVKNADVKVSGLSKISIDVKDSLTTNISGKGTVVYNTPPAYLKTNNSGLAHMGDGETAANDTTRLNFGNTTVLVIGKDHNYNIDIDNGPRKSYFHWGGVEFGYNNYVNADNKFEIPDQYGYLKLRTGKAVFFNLNLFDFKFDLVKDHLFLGSGLGFSFRNYYFSTQDSILVPNASTVTAAPATAPWFKNKLAVDYLTVPLMLEYNTSKYNENAFHVGAGMVFNLKMGSRVKTKSSDIKAKDYNDFNVRTVEWDARVQVGYGVLNLFATYSLNSLFKNNQGPELKPMTFGIGLAGW